MEAGRGHGVPSIQRGPSGTSCPPQERATPTQHPLPAPSGQATRGSNARGHFSKPPHQELRAGRSWEGPQE